MIHLELDRDRRFASITVEGELKDADVLRWFEDFLRAMAPLRGVGGLVDTRGVTVLDVSATTVRRMTEQAERYDAAFAGSRWALVADQDALFGLSRMYEMLRDDSGFEIAVFRSLDEARAWLAQAPSA